MIVLDASNLDNHLRFALQLIELGLPTIIALNMVDVAEANGQRIDADKLAGILGVPVMPIVCCSRRCVSNLKLAVVTWSWLPLTASVPPGSRSDPEAMAPLLFQPL